MFYATDILDDDLDDEDDDDDLLNIYLCSYYADCLLGVLLEAAGVRVLLGLLHNRVLLGLLDDNRVLLFFIDCIYDFIGLLSVCSTSIDFA